MAFERINYGKCKGNYLSINPHNKLINISDGLLILIKKMGAQYCDFYYDDQIKMFSIDLSIEPKHHDSMPKHNAKSTPLSTFSAKPIFSILDMERIDKKTVRVPYSLENGNILLDELTLRKAFTPHDEFTKRINEKKEKANKIRGLKVAGKR